MKRFEDRIAVVTGAGGGIGRATALELAKRGCHLALADIREEAVAEVANEIEALGRRVTCHKLDVADANAFAGFRNTVIREHGGAHVIVNNAGVDAVAALHEQSFADFEWVMNVNMWGVMHGTRAFLPDLLAAEEGHVVNISSIAGLVAFPTQTAYCASKFAVRGFTEALQLETSGTRVGVTCVHPGMVRTDVLRSAKFSDAEAQQRLITLMDRRGLEPSKVASRIARAIARRKARVVIGVDARLLLGLAKVPPLYRWVFRRLLRAQAANEKTGSQKT